MLKHKGKRAWWNAAACERTDRIDVTAEGARRLCARSDRWAALWPGGERMSQFFLDAGERLREPPADSSAPLARAALISCRTPAARER